MKYMKHLLTIGLILPVLLISCGAKPALKTEEPLIVEEQTVTKAPAEQAPVEQPMAAEFDPGIITQEYYESTKTDVQQYISELNGIIRNKNYNSWKANLSDEYFREISSPEFLKVTSEWPALKNRKIVLKTAQDYFTYVVVPSRANSVVDDIEFTCKNRVKVYTLNSRNERLRLYELEQTGNTWKIIN